LKTKFGGNDLSSKIVACEVHECIASLIKTGFPVNPPPGWTRLAAIGTGNMVETITVMVVKKIYFSLTRMGVSSCPYEQGVINLVVSKYNAS
jgi:hypothetical protein